MDNTNIQAIRTPTRSTMLNKCLKCGKSYAFHREACPAFGSKCNTCGKSNHWASMCLQTEQNQNKGRGHKAENTKKQNLTINHNIGENST